MTPTRYHHTATLSDANGTIATVAKVFTDARSSVRSGKVQRWLDTLVTVNPAATQIEVTMRYNGGEPLYSWYNVANGRAQFDIHRSNNDQRNVEASARFDREHRARQAAEMQALTAPFDGNSEGYAWDTAHNFVKFTGNQDVNLYEVQPYRKTCWHYWTPAGTPVWVPKENIVTNDVPRRVSEDGNVLPGKSMYPYFNGIDATLPREV
jgi:hypothetical protein